MSATPLLSREELTERLRAEGSKRYHDHHPFHQRMHEGTLSRRQLQLWVLNRYYYQTRIPIKDAIILSKSEDPEFRRVWIHRITDHDGTSAGEGGLELWLRLAEGVGLSRERVRSCADVLPQVRAACDRYVALVRERSLIEAVASSLTEFFAPDIMSRRIAAWEKHYPWVEKSVLEYFRTRVTKARRDSGEAIEMVVTQATTRELQDKCVAALIDKCGVLWEMVDAIAGAAGAKLGLAQKARLQWDELEKKWFLLYPERGLALNATGAEVVKLLTGELSADEIVARLQAQFAQADRETIAREVDAFLSELDGRGLLRLC
jgi:pyrroloquinoline-quinone synthase